MKILQPSVRLADPHICSDAKNRLNILTQLFDTLVFRDESGAFVPGLASHFSLAEDARTWTFVCRQDVVFHNGDAFTAADVVGSLRRACDPAVGGELGTEGVWAGYIGDAEIEAVDQYTVRMVTSQPMADLLDLLVAIPIAPVSALADLPNNMIGSGPYRLTKRSDDEVILTPFDDSVVRKPSITGSTLSFREETDQQKRLEALRNGDADLITNIEAKEADHFEGDGLGIISHQSNLCVAFLCNIQQGPCTDKTFRQAINYATNVEAMIDRAMDGGASPLNGPLTPLHYGSDYEISPYAYDPEKAKSLLAESDAPKRVAIDLPTTLPDESPVLGEMLKNDLNAVGIEVELRFYEDRPAYAHMVKRKEIADICCFDSSPLSTYRVLREKVNSDVAGPWWQGYDNAAVNRLLDQAAETVDSAAREAVYKEAYRMMHDDAPWVFLYRPTIYFGATNEVAKTVSISISGLLELSRF